MTLQQLYEFIIQEGIKSDPRLRCLIDQTLEERKRYFKSLAVSQKEYFDQECLRNPYDDTRILTGEPKTPVKNILVGIDIDTSELLLADWLKKTKKEKIDLVVSHHPQGKAYAHFYEVMDMQSDIFNALGVPISVAERLVEERKFEVSRKIHSANHDRAVDSARLLGLSFLCVHTPADNHASSYLQGLLKRKNPSRLCDILDLLNTVEEFKTASRLGVDPRIVSGKPSQRAGKIFVDMTGGTEGPKEIAEDLSRAGVSTILGMHASEDHLKKFREKKIHVVIAGHIAADSLGMNLLLDKIQRSAKINILTCSGFKRVKR
ncbi:MAG: NGG1p interacting factor NIF3 [Candidatus Omnitrophota bacterium]